MPHQSRHETTPGMQGAVANSPILRRPRQWHCRAPRLHDTALASLDSRSRDPAAARSRACSSRLARGDDASRADTGRRGARTFWVECAGRTVGGATVPSPRATAEEAGHGWGGGRPQTDQTLSVRAWTWCRAIVPLLCVMQAYRLGGFGASDVQRQIAAGPPRDRGERAGRPTQYTTGTRRL